MRLFGSKDIKSYVKKYIEANASRLKGAVVVDIPAGTGFSTRLLQRVKADVRPFDLFPEFFKVEGLHCESADLNGAMPMADATADVVLFQEGIEHLPNQLHVLQEMNRVLKPQGTLLLTTPNSSSLRARFSYLLNESENYKLMPPNQIESIWFGDNHKEERRYYFGHMFLVGIQRLKLLATLAGFRIRRIHHTRVNMTSLVLLLFFYPLIWMSSYRAYRRALRKNKFVGQAERRALFKESFALMVSPKVLLDRHLFIEFEKVMMLDEINDSLAIYHKHRDTDFQT